MTTGSSAFRKACAEHDPALAQSLGARGADEVALQHLLHRGAGHARQERHRAHPERDRRQDQIREPARARRRQPAQVHGEDQDQEQADPVHRERHAEVGAERGEAVGPARRDARRRRCRCRCR